jgi:hypothetical protein
MENIKFRAKATGTDFWVYGLPHAVYSDNLIDSIHCDNQKIVVI